jgi:hypothetical protein
MAERSDTDTSDISTTEKNFTISLQMYQRRMLQRELVAASQQESFVVDDAHHPSIIDPFQNFCGG